jgi:hypothetical protein
MIGTKLILNIVKDQIDSNMLKYRDLIDNKWLNIETKYFKHREIIGKINSP